MLFLIDCSVEFLYGVVLEFVMLEVWESEMVNGIKVIGIFDGELLFVRFFFVIDGGYLFDVLEIVGMVNLFVEIFIKGMVSKILVEFDNVFVLFGVDVMVDVFNESF